LVSKFAAVRKVLIQKPGGLDRLDIVDAPELAPGPDEVIVENEAIGVNFADVVVRMGLYESARKLVGWPITPGFEFAGHVKSVGAGVNDLSPGQQVFGVSLFGAYASSVRVPRHQVFDLPAGLTMAQGATFPVAFLTAWYALVELVRLRPRMNLLIHSAAGGVGSALLQIGHIYECRMIGVVGSPHKVTAARELGADIVIDKSREPLWPTVERHAPEGLDVVCDANGVETLRQSYAHLRPSGRLVVYGFHSMLKKGKQRPNWPKLAADFLRTPRFNPMWMCNENKSVLAFNLSYLFERRELLSEAMSMLLRWLAEGKLRFSPVRELPFESVRDAHQALESGQTVGKLALSVK
jgi:NADPH:quinone reductase-like Zn-dependent oxidoreductase